MMGTRNGVFLSVAGCLFLHAAAFGDDSNVVNNYDEDSIRSEPVSYVEADDHIDLQARIASLESQIEWLNRGQRIDVLGTFERQQAWRARGSGGIYAGAEVGFLRPYLSGAMQSNNNRGGKWIDPSYGSSLRYILGYRNDCGFGVRGRYFGFNHTADLARSLNVPGSIGINMDAADAEITLRGHLRNWTTEVAGGLRYGKLDYRSDGVLMAPGHVTFEGVGPSAAFDARRKIGNSGLTLFGNIRGSLLLGTTRNGGTSANPVITNMQFGNIEDEITHIIENQLGLAWTHNCENGLTLEIRTAWETQFWLNDTLADDVYGIGTNLALSGPTVAVELLY